jgi:hypothetical protein
MRRWVWLLAGGLGCSVAWVVSCVSDSNTGIPPGTDGGPCLQNGTCDNGLVCGLVNGNGVCQPPGSDASSDSPSKNDAGSDGSPSDSGVSDADATCNPQPAFDFVNPCDGGAACYDELDADFACVVCPGPYTQFFSPPCTRSIGTSKSAVCCVQSASLVDAGGCVLTLDITGSAGTLAEPACGAGGKILCGANADCAHALDAGLVTLGVCTPVILRGVPPLNGVVAGVCQ